MIETVGVGLAAVAVGYLAGRFQVHRLQHVGEVIVSKTLQSAFASADCHLLNNVTLSVPDGTTQIDHVLVSRRGVFVIETKHYKGWIFASATSPQWTQVLYRKKFKFQNPLHQNLKHVKAVQALLDFLRPPGVHSLRGLVDFLKSFDGDVISENRMQFCVGRLECQRLALTRQTDVEHRARLMRRFGDLSD
jgi:restriction system protein